MHVTMLIQIQGPRNGEAWPAPGHTIELPDHEAVDLIAAGYAKEGTADATPDEHDEPDTPDGPATETDEHDGRPADVDAGTTVPKARRPAKRTRK